MTTSANRENLQSPRTNVTADSRRPGAFRWLTAAAVALAGVDAFAQLTPVAPATNSGEVADEVVELSPFVVSAATDRGYIATSTLAGGRTKMELRDVAAQVSVFTSELMRDLGATNLEEVLLYSGNVEGYLDYAPGSGAGYGVYRNANPTRSRGLAGISNTRNGFPSAMDPDNYNMDRLSLISGPNALLFGMGSPAGIGDAGLNRARLNTVKGSATLRLDDEGSKRLAFDLNQPLIRDRLALRFDGVRDRREYWLKPSDYRNDRAYLALTGKPTATTTVNVNSEWADVWVQRAATQYPYDSASVWLDRGSVPWDNTPGHGIGGNPLYRAANGTFFVYGNVADPGVMTFANAAAPRPYYDATLFPGTQDVDSGVVPPFTRPGIIPADVNWFGLTRASHWSGSSQIASVEQRVGHDFFAELAFQREAITTIEGGLLSGNAGGYGTSSYTINVDPNRYLADGVTPNPQLGKYYVQGGGGGAGYHRDEARENRLTLSYDLRLAERRDGWRWLGTHRFMAMGSVRDTYVRDQANDALVVGTPSFVRPADIANLAGASRSFTGRYYLDELGRGNRFGPEMVGDTVFGPWTFTDPATGKDFQVFTINNPGGSSSVPSLNRQRILSRALADTATLLNGRLVLLAGWREDRTRTKGALAEDLAADPVTRMYQPVGAARYNPSWEEYSGGESMTYGVVYHPWASKWLSLHYNRSSNYSPPPGLLDPFDRPIPGSSGVGRDYGVRVEFAQGRYSARLNFFENSQVGFSSNGQVNKTVRNAYDVEKQMKLLNPSMPDFGMNAARARTDYGDTIDFDAEGMDLDLIANPTKDWRIFASIGRQKTVTSNTGIGLDAWIKARTPVFQSYPSWTTERMPTGTQTIAESFQNSVANPYYYDLVLKNGAAADNQREWRGNIVANYSFPSGRLKGWTIGGATRYRSGATIGYALRSITLPNGQTSSISDLGRPYRSSEELTWDGLMRYEFKWEKRIRCRVQLNVRNLLDDNLRVPVAAYTNGTISRYIRQEPRTFMLETSVTF